MKIPSVQLNAHSDAAVTFSKSNKNESLPATSAFNNLLNSAKQSASPAEKAEEKNKQQQAAYSAEVERALDLGLYEYILQKKEEELRGEAQAQVFADLGISEETYSSLPEVEQKNIDAMIEERYQALRKALIEELIAQFKQQLQQHLDSGDQLQHEQPQGPPMALHFIPPAG